MRAAWRALLLVVGLTGLGVVGLKSLKTADDRANLDLPASVEGSSDEEETLPELVVFYGKLYESDGFFFCCDKSGSMNVDNKFLTLRKEVQKDLNGLTDRAQFSEVFFSDVMSQFPASGRPLYATQPAKIAGSAFVQSMVPNGGTCPKAALLASLRFANQSTVRHKLILYLSDGFNTCPGVGSVATYNQDILATVKAANVQKVEIDTIALGDLADDRWLNELAVENGGSFSHARG